MREGPLGRGSLEDVGRRGPMCEGRGEIEGRGKRLEERGKGWKGTRLEGGEGVEDRVG